MFQLSSVFDCRKRVVITGIGLITPFAADREASWSSLQRGASATRWLSEGVDSDASTSVTGPTATGLHVGAPAPILTDEAPRNDHLPDDPVVALALHAAHQAIADADLSLDPNANHRVGCVIGTSKGGLRSFSRLFSQSRDKETLTPGPGEAKSSELATHLWNQFLPNAASLAVSRSLNLTGPVLCPVAACATGLVSLLRGAELIRDGVCDAVIAGSTDASLQDSVLGSFQRMGVLARGFDDPKSACRPFDQSRNGFVVGEGAAVLVLESEEHAAERGAKSYAEWVGGGLASDIAGLTNLDAQATGLTWLITDLLRRSGLAPDEIDYVNLHGTATIQNDVCESRAIRSAFGSAANGLSCSSLKGAIGHLLGAAGSVEVATTLLAMRDGIVPPTVNLEEPDALCNLDYTPRVARQRTIEHALKISLGFGGHLVAAILRKTRYTARGHD